MKMSVEPVCAMSFPFSRFADSSTRTTVVPTAAIRLASLILAAAEGEIEKCSAYMRCSAMFSERTGRNVPVPTCNVTNACGISLKISAVKWRPAVGAASAPGDWAKTVW